MKNGDIWFFDLSDAKWYEQRGVRPEIIMGSANGLTVVVPCTTTLSTARFSPMLSLTSTPTTALMMRVSHS